jgi:hypothetical protein
MRYLLLFAGILCLFVILVFVFLKLLRDLLVRDFFDAPLLPDAAADTAAGLERKTESQSAQPYSG